MFILSRRPRPSSSSSFLVLGNDEIDDPVGAIVGGMVESKAGWSGVSSRWRRPEFAGS